MNKQHKRDKFSYTVTENSITIEGGFEVSLSDTAKLISLLNTMMGMRSLPVLPPFIGDYPFKIEFLGDGKFNLTKEGVGLEIGFSEVDNFVVGLNESKQIAIDTTLLRGKARPPQFQNLRANNIDLIEGRE
jgi:hypothetical protein